MSRPSVRDKNYKKIISDAFGMYYSEIGKCMADKIQQNRTPLGPVLMK